MKLIAYPGNPLRGTAVVPGDKSLSHRAVLFAALAEGESRIDNFLISGVTRAMLDALTAFRVEWHLDGRRLTVLGRGLQGWKTPDQAVFCGNSATTMRLLAGAVAAAGIEAVLDGSPGLRRRPMDRIVEPLRAMGTQVETTAGQSAPLHFLPQPDGFRLHGLDTLLPVASAQVKSCLLLAGLAAETPTVLREPGPSRDHTERMLNSMGADVTSRKLAAERMYETRLLPLSRPLCPLNLCLPGDISAAAFLVVAAAMTPGSEVRIPGVGLNPTRTGLLDALRAMGADVCVENESLQAGEPAGDLLIRAAKLRGTRVDGDLVVRMIDEFSVFGTAAAFAEGETLVRDARELRFKESDRIRTLCEELRALGGTADELEDGFSIQGGRLDGGAVQAHGDHRLAMAMAVAGLAARSPVSVEGAEIINESFPEYIQVLRGLGAHLETLPAQ